MQRSHQELYLPGSRLAQTTDTSRPVLRRTTYSLKAEFQ